MLQGVGQESHQIHAHSTQMSYDDVSPIDEAASFRFPLSNVATRHGSTAEPNSRLQQYEQTKARTVVWNPGASKRIPWSSLIASLGAVISSIGITLVIVKANGKPVDAWTTHSHNVAPTVLLALFVGITNGCIRFVISEGANISWWIKSMDSNSKVADLHRYWSAGASVLGSLACGPRFNRVAVVSLVTFVVTFASGPLLQSAISPAYQISNHNTSIFIPINQGPLPTGFTGLTSDGSGDYFPTPGFRQIVTDYQSHSPIVVDYNNTQGLYNTIVQAPGFDIECTESTTPLTITQDEDQNNMSLNVTGNLTEDSGTIFIDFATTNGSSEPDPTLNPSTCRTFMFQRHCTLRIAKVSYPLILSSGTVILPRQAISTNQTIELQTLPPEESIVGTSPSTIGGILQTASDIWASKSKLSNTSAGLTTGFVGHAYNVKWNDLGSCDAYWGDPSEDVFNSIREIAFRSAIAASTKSEGQLVSATDTSPRMVYKSHAGWLAATLVMIILNIIGLLPLFIGFPRLGRRTSMSPVEVAKAFEAPILSGCAANASVDSLLKDVGSKRVMYGEPIGGNAVRGTLRMGDPDKTMKPRKVSEA